MSKQLTKRNSAMAEPGFVEEHAHAFNPLEGLDLPIAVSSVPSELREEFETLFAMIALTHNPNDPVRIQARKVLALIPPPGAATTEDALSSEASSATPGSPSFEAALPTVDIVKPPDRSESFRRQET